MLLQTDKKLAVKKAKEHAHTAIQAVLYDNQGKQLHEIPFGKVIAKAGEALSKHPDFKFEHGESPDYTYSHEKPETRKKLLRAIDGQGNLFYHNYELAHHIIKAIVISEVKQEHHLNQADEKLLETALGEEHYRPQKEEYENMIKAVEELQKNLGNEKTDEILEKARITWTNHYKPGPAEPENYFGDAFTNAAQHTLQFAFVANKKNLDTTLAEKYKKHLKTMSNY